MLTAILWITAAAAGDVYQPHTVHDVDLLPNGNILVTDGGSMNQPSTGGVYEIDRVGNIAWSYTAGLSFAHNADQDAGGNVIISDTGNDRVIIVNAAGSIIWNSADVPLSDGSQLHYPNDANLLSNGNILITDRDNHRALEITTAGTKVWQFGQTGVPGGGATRLRGPHNADRLTNGNTVIADSNNQRIVEVSPAGGIVWVHTGGLNWPRDADRLANGNTLIVDSNNLRIIEVTAAHATVWTYAVITPSYDADRLDTGNTLISAGGQIVEVDPNGATVWSYPAAGTVETVWILNPASGVNLYCHVHRPAGFNPALKYPGVVLAPGGNGAGTSFDNGNTAQQYADLGFIVMHFDPDGRGQSTNGGSYTTEDYCGYLQQEGMHQVLLYLAALPETDNSDLGIITSSYGITLGAGVAGRFPNSPPVKHLMDWEGPADRTDTAQPNGHVPHDPNDDVWWYEREPTNFIDDFDGRYLRVQSLIDHVQADNEHAIKLLNKATNTVYGGFGMCLWTRCNSAIGYTNNLPNTVYSTADQPEYLAESVNAGQVQREYLVELANMSRLPSDGDLNCDGTSDFDDIGTFVLALGGQDGYEASYATCDWWKADCNADSNVDFDDISAFVALLGQ
jgi:hypothetical protein